MKARAARVVRRAARQQVTGGFPWWRMASRTLRHLENLLFLARFKGFDQLDPTQLAYYMNRIAERAKECEADVKEGYKGNHGAFAGIPKHEPRVRTPKIEVIDENVRCLKWGDDMVHEFEKEECDIAITYEGTRIEFWKSYDGTLTRVIFFTLSTHLKDHLQDFFGHLGFLRDASGKKKDDEIVHIDMNTPWARQLLKYLMSKGYEIPTATKPPPAKINMGELKKTAPPVFPANCTEFEQ